MKPELLQVETVSKSFGNVPALDGVSLDMAPGKRVALLGHNGAGKTTLFRLILGFTRPDRGQVSIAGEGPGTPAARRIVSYLPENVMFPKSLTGREILAFYQRLKRVPKDETTVLLERVGLIDAADRGVGTYSKGMRQRLGLAQALAGAPRLLLLDEPTTGLDPQSRIDFYTLVDEVAAAGAAVLLSSHSLSELETRTDGFAILRNGRLVANGSLAQLQADSAVPLRIRVRTLPDSIDQVAERLGANRVNGQSLELLCPVPEKMSRLAEINALGPLVTDFDLTPPTLDDVYHHYSTQAEEEHGP